MKIDILANCTIQYMLKNKDTDMPKFCPITNIDIPLSIDVADDVVPYIKIYLNNIEEYELAKKEKRIANEHSYDVNDIFISSWYKILKKAYKDIINKKMESNLLVEYAIQYSVFGIAEDYIDEHWDTTISKKFLSIIPVDDCNYYIANKIIKIIKFNLK